VQPVAYDLYQITAPINRQNRQPGDPCHTLARDNAAHAAVAFQQNTRDEVRLMNGDGAIAGALSAEAGMKQQNYVAAIQGNLVGRDTGGPHGVGASEEGAMYTLTKADTHAVAVSDSLVANNNQCTGIPTEVVSHAMTVRRLTPRECERLQGFPDDYTAIPWRGKTETPDGPRYKALGNSMAVNCMEWIGERIAAQEAR
jgi:DNA (cytosine-5)-methyltransferase 1